jgi:serine/threonine-protein kinase
MSAGQDLGEGVVPGDLIAGKYRVEKVLGIGGMGVVVSARHLALDEQVAIKLLLPETLKNPEAVSRFVREARAAVKIKSEHVARVSDVGQLENGSPYMVMEFLQGGDLADWLTQNGPLPFEQAVDFVLQACVAVADAHALGIVHRDLKPSNLYCVRRSDGQLMIKVLDFGISKMTNLDGSATGAELTKTNAVMGSPLYMSPEQMRSARDVDSATDTWALGVILFELITGRRPFSADTLTELVMKVASDAPPPLATYRPDAPPGLDEVIATCLAKDRRKRYPNVGALSLALLPFAPKRSKVWVERIAGIIQAAGLSQSALAVPVSPKETLPQATTAPEGSGTLPPLGRTTTGGGQRKSSRVWGGIVGGVLVIGATAGASMAVMSRKPATLSEPAQAAAASTPVPVTVATATASPAPAAPSTAAPLTAALIPLPSSAPAASTSAAASTHPHATSSSPSARGAGLSPKATAAGKTSCDPPFYFDAKGTKIFKPECPL